MELTYVFYSNKIFVNFINLLNFLKYSHFDVRQSSCEHKLILSIVICVKTVKNCRIIERKSLVSFSFS